jgi:hypothetical protein
LEVKPEVPFMACKKSLAGVKEILTRLNSHSFRPFLIFLPDYSAGRIARELW